jgi:hypothetical protein
MHTQSYSEMSQYREKPLRSQRRNQDDRIKMDLREVSCTVVMGSLFGLWWEWCCEPSCFIRSVGHFEIVLELREESGRIVLHEDDLLLLLLLLLLS